MLKDHDHILVPLDGSPLAEGVLPHVVAFARILDAPIILMRVVVPEHDTSESGAVDPLAWQIRKTEAEAYLANVAARLQALDLEVTSETVEGQPAERIVYVANERKAGLVILSSHGSGGLSPWNISSTVQKVMLRLYAPALIVRAYHAEEVALDALTYRRLLVPLDGSRRAETVISFASTVARSHAATLLTAHVVRRPEVPRNQPLDAEEHELVERLVAINREAATRYLENLRGRLACDVEPRLLVAGNPTVALQQLAQQENVDLTLITAHGYSGEAQWPYGSIALAFIAYGTTPLFIMQDLSEDDIVRSVAAEAAAESKGH
jgi:nucleotide-binding universal stress UspA family protein